MGLFTKVEDGTTPSNVYNLGAACVHIRDDTAWMTGWRFGWVLDQLRHQQGSSVKPLPVDDPFRATTLPSGLLLIGAFWLHESPR
ncbi:hypothetical protein LZ554_008629 [Drepanopeziza brunnea f. sp. 'monogermtubi']|nr:hypothetical protein LZ554_008629 [Drepanopeziza brunnea f. sp. 'monogermtubi']